MPPRPIRYSLDELLAQCDFGVPYSPEERAFLDAEPRGREWGAEGARMNKDDVAEVWLADAWVRIGIDEALSAYRGELMRCAECHGQVYPHRA